MTELGEFLRARRARLNPADFGLPGARRRVPGLRREELAQLAGISADYYTRLEQGRATNASPSILDALGRVLGLDVDERAHLTRLAHPARGPVPQVKVRPALRWLLDSLENVPAFVLGRRMDLLAWNSLAGALLPDALAHGNLMRSCSWTRWRAPCSRRGRSAHARTWRSCGWTRGTIRTTPR